MTTPQRPNPTQQPSQVAVRQNTTPTVKPIKALDILAGKLQIDAAKLYSTLKNTCFKPAKGEAEVTDEELMALVVVANTYQLNPVLREFYAFRDKRGGIVPVVSVDGWVNLINREEKMDGVEFEFSENSDGTVFSCTCTIYMKNRSHPCRITEYFSECYRDTGPWNQMPHRMMRHKSLKECGRVAFGFSGIYDEDEARDFASVDPVVNEPVFDGPKEIAAPAPQKSLQPARNQPPIDVKAEKVKQPEPAKTAAQEPPDDDRIPYEFQQASEPAPKQPATAPEPPQDAPKPHSPTEGKAHTVNAVLALLEEIGATPEDCLAWMAKMKLIDPAAKTLESVPHSKLLEVVAKWPNIKFGVKGAAQ